MFRTQLFLVALSIAVSKSSIAVAHDKQEVLQEQQQHRWLQETTNGTDLVLDHNETEHHEEEEEQEEGVTTHSNETEHHEEDGEEHSDVHAEEDEHADEDEHGHEDEHGAEEEELFLEGDGTTSKPWGEVIVASLLINLVTLIGVFFLSGEFFAKHVLKRDIMESPYYVAFTHNVVPSFACGALMATTVFLVLPESLALITAHFAGGHGDEHRFLEEEHEEEEEVNAEAAVAWRFGACIISGFLLPVFTSFIFPHNHDLLEELSVTDSPNKAETEMLKGVPEEAAVEDGIPKEIMSDATAIADQSKADTRTSMMTTKSVSSADGSDIVVKTGDKVLPHAIDWSLAASVMAGDFFHNFADGIFVGTSFMLCSRDLAITISAATIYHEIAQEVADYFMLTRFCHIPPCKALCFNFLNGLSVMLGACLILGVEEMTGVAIGCILAVSAGVYIYISVAECFPRAKEAQHTNKDRIIAFLSFVFGVVPIGLVLLNHGHCEAAH